MATETDPGQLEAAAPFNAIDQLAGAANWLFCLRNNGSIWFADATQVPMEWQSIVYGGTGNISEITGICFPGPMGMSYLFTHADDDSLFSYNVETGEWLNRVYPP
jgi:hypothetical protein